MARKTTRKAQLQRKSDRSHRETQLSFEQLDDRFRDVFLNHEFGDLSHEARRQLVRFYQMLIKDQHRHNSTRLVTIRDVAIKHFIDSLIVARLTNLMFPLLDVGTGPGFPGIPLKILYPEERIILGESVERRVEFLKDVRETLALPNLDIVGRKIKDDFALPVKGVISRAFNGGSLTELLQTVRVCLPEGGRAYMMKGPGADPELERAVRELKDVYELEKDISYSLPNTPQKRRLLIFKKLVTDLPAEESDDEVY